MTLGGFCGPESRSPGEVECSRQGITHGACPLLTLWCLTQSWEWKLSPPGELLGTGAEWYSWISLEFPRGHEVEWV